MFISDANNSELIHETEFIFRKLRKRHVLVDTIDAEAVFVISRNGNIFEIFTGQKVASDVNLFFCKLHK